MSGRNGRDAKESYDPAMPSTDADTSGSPATSVLPDRAGRYGAASTPERFSVIRFGTYLSGCVFAVITVAWAYLVIAW